MRVGERDPDQIALAATGERVQHRQSQGVVDIVAHVGIEDQRACGEAEPRKQAGHYRNPPHFHAVIRISRKASLAIYNALMKSILALSVVFIAQSLLAADTLPAARAKDHVGENGTVCGKVADTRYLESGRRPTFLNFDQRYPNHTFTAVIFGEDRAKFGVPEKDYLDKDICVTGKIEDFSGKPQIIVTELQQIKAASK